MPGNQRKPVAGVLALKLLHVGPVAPMGRLSPQHYHDQETTMTRTPADPAYQRWVTVSGQALDATAGAGPATPCCWK